MKYHTLPIAFLFLHLYTIAQTPKSTYSLKEAVEYAVVNNNNVKNRVLDARVAQAQKNEQGARGLPQISGNVDFLHYQNIQKNIIENTQGASFYNSSLPLGTPIAFAFTLPNQLIPTVTGSQVLFDQAFFAGLKASKVYEELMEKNVSMTKIDVALAVTKAYYAVLVNERQLTYINVNLNRVDSIYLQTKAQYNNGLVRTLDVDRSEVTYNNLKEEKIRVQRLLDLSISLLKFQMNLSQSDSLRLTDELNETTLSELTQLSDDYKIAYSDRIEYSIIQSQALFNKIDRRTTQGGFYPRLSAIGLIGYNPGASKVSNLTQSDRWYQYSYLGLRLQVPLFNGFANRYRVQQKKLQEEKTAINKQQLEKQIDLEVDQSIINLKNSLESLKTQKRNLTLAEQTLKVLKAEQLEGIGTSLDVTVAEADFKSALNNYYSALYNSLVSKADYQKATGTLLK